MNILESKLQRPNGSAKSDERLAVVDAAAQRKTGVFVHSTNAIDLDRQRNRRDAPGCVTNYKAQRRLWVGCTDPDIIDVRPMCNEDGDEGEYALKSVLVLFFSCLYITSKVKLRISSILLIFIKISRYSATLRLKCTLSNEF